MSDYKQETKNRYKGYIQIIGILLLCMVVLCLIVPSANAVSIDEIKHQSVVYSPITQYNNYTNTTMNNINDSYAVLTGKPNGQILYGGNSVNDDLILSGTSSATKTTSYVNIQPNGGFVGINTSSPNEHDQNSVLTLNGNLLMKNTGVFTGDIQFDNNAVNIYRSGSPSEGILNLDGFNNVTIPDTKIVITEVGATEQVRIIDDGIFYGRFGYDQAGNTILGLYNTYTGALSRIDFGFGSSSIAGTTPKLSIFGNGNVSIGTTSPTAQFQTTGPVKIPGIGGAGTVMIDASGNLYTSSNEAKKTDIVEYKPVSALSKINGVKPYTFKWDKSSGLSTTETNLGFIIEQLKTAIPEAVSTKHKLRYDMVLTTKGKTTQEDIYSTIETELPEIEEGVSDRAIIAVQVLAIQELSAKVDKQNDEIKRLTERLDRAGVKS